MPHLFTLALLIAAFGLGYPPAFAQETSEDTVSAETAPQPSDRALRILHRFLKKELGADPEGVDAETDIVLDLGVDQTDLYFALLAFYEKLNIKPPAEDMTRVGDIALYIDNAPPAQIETDKGASEQGEEETYVQKVFFATNRKATDSKNPEDAFDGMRAADRKLAYGLARVNIPVSYHKKGRIETPFREIRWLRNPRKHIYIIDFKNLGQDGFFNALKDPAYGKDDLLVYVHGFNVTFNDAIRRAAQIAFDFEFQGIPVAFTWPSDGDAGLRPYNSDWQDVLWSVKYIEGFLRDLKTRFPDRRIHLIAHSMGNKGLLYALRLMAYGRTPDSPFGTIMLCAPDFDADLFAEQIAPEVRALAEHWVVYSSEKDVALIASEIWNTAPRLGMQATPAEGYQIVDATELPVTPWSVPETHSYYANHKRVLDDMVQAIAGRSPAERGLEKRIVDAGSIWVLQMP